MRIFKTQEQKNGLAKLNYDLAKIVFALAILQPFLEYKINSYFFIIIGCLAFIILCVLGFLTDGRKL